MSESRPDWAEIDALFDAALERPEAEREAFVRERAGESALAEELLSLLAAERESAEFLEADPSAEDGAEPGSLHPGERLGAWRIEALIARGGMGEVYHAERADGLYEQRAALKLMKPLSDEYRPMFDGERQFLARLEHPGIARLLDGGLSADGRPFMVMEFADGAPIGAWVRERSPHPRRIVSLVLQAGEALAYAHAKLILHRDVKPSNILVDEQGRVRVIDFGVARIAGEDAGRAPVSLDFAAPELFEGETATVASDVYGLAATLYALLAGRPPLSLGEHPLPVAARRATEDAPPRLGALRPDAKRDPFLRDVEAVLERALAKSPRDRYRTVEAFCEELERALEGEAVAARRAERGYAAGRFLRRHVWQTLSVAAIAISLTGGLSAALWQARQAEIERDWALREQTRLEAVQQYLYFMLRDGADAAGGAQASADEILEAAAEQVTEMFAADPERGGPVMHTLGELYFYLNDYEAAAPMLRRVVETEGVEPGVLARARYDLAQVELRFGDTDAAEPLLEQAQAFWEAEPGRWNRRLVDSRLVEARLLRDQGRLGEAVSLLEDSLAERIDLAGEIDRGVGVHHNDLGVMRIAAGELDAAREPLEAAREIWDELGLAESPDALNTLNNLASIEALQGRFEQAAPLFEEAVRLRRTLYGDSAATAALLNNYGKILLRLGRVEESLPLLEEAAAMALDHAGPAGTLYPSAMAGLSEAQAASGESDAALETAREGHERVSEAAGEDSPAAAVIAIALARETASNGDVDRARELLDGAEAAFEPMGPGAAPQLQAIEAVRTRFELD